MPDALESEKRVSGSVVLNHNPLAPPATHHRIFPLLSPCGTPARTLGVLTVP